jgi:hypothetical protein
VTSLFELSTRQRKKTGLIDPSHAFGMTESWWTVGQRLDTVIPTGGPQNAGRSGGIY